MIFAAISLALMSAASQSAAQEPPEGPVLSLPAPATAQTLPDTTEPEVLQNAQTYAAYRSDVTLAGERELLSGADLDATMDALSQYYDGDRLVNAQIAYAERSRDDAVMQGASPGQLDGFERRQDDAFAAPCREAFDLPGVTLHRQETLRLSGYDQARFDGRFQDTDARRT